MHEHDKRNISCNNRPRGQKIEHIELKKRERKRSIDWPCGQRKKERNRESERKQGVRYLHLDLGQDTIRQNKDQVSKCSSSGQIACLAAEGSRGSRAWVTMGYGVVDALSVCSFSSASLVSFWMDLYWFLQQLHFTVGICNKPKASSVTCKTTLEPETREGCLLYCYICVVWKGWQKIECLTRGLFREPSRGLTIPCRSS